MSKEKDSTDIQTEVPKDELQKAAKKAEEKKLEATTSGSSGEVSTDITTTGSMNTYPPDLVPTPGEPQNSENGSGDSEVEQNDPNGVAGSETSENHHSVKRYGRKDRVKKIDVGVYQDEDGRYSIFTWGDIEDKAKGDQKSEYKKETLVFIRPWFSLTTAIESKASYSHPLLGSQVDIPQLSIYQLQYYWRECSFCDLKIGQDSDGVDHILNIDEIIGKEGLDPAIIRGVITAMRRTVLNG